MKQIVCVILYMTLTTTCSTGQQIDRVTKRESLDAQSFQAKLKETSDAFLLDVRTPEEVAQGKIKDATNMDFNSIDFKKKISTLDKNKTYFVYCAKGVRSGKAVDLMSSLGFKKLVSLQDGFVGWKEKGLPVEINKIN